ncbi:MAG: alpha/beta hydrolase [Gammaproteobacteria bacterium]
MSKETIERVTSGDACFWTVRTGRGPPLVWCHGGPGLWDSLAPVAAMTDDLVTIYRYDQRGCGRTSGGGPHTLARNVLDLETLRRHWRLDRFIVAGHSWGAELALHYALGYPDRLAGLIYLSGGGIDPVFRAEYRVERARRLGPEGERERKALEAVWLAQGTLEAERRYCEIQWSTDFTDATTARQHARSLFVADLRVNRRVNTELHADAGRVTLHTSMPMKLRSLKVPTLVIHGSEDPRPAKAAAQVADLLPNAELTLIPGAGHYLWVEAPELLRKTLREYICRS